MVTNEPTPFHNLVFETAQEHISSRVPVVTRESTVREIRDQLAKCRYETVAEIVVCENGRLVGLINIEDVLPATDETLACDLMDAEPPAVLPGMDQERAAWEAVQHGEASLAVIDHDGRFHGLIPPQRLLRVLLQEHDEDIARFGGFLKSTRAARIASEEGLFRRLWHRLPWLFLGLAGAVLSADMVGIFESQLKTNVMLAFFIPGVVYLADAVGTQTETLVIRGLSIGVPLRQMVKREIMTGILVGISLIAVFFPLALLRWGWDNRGICAAVSLALLAACSTATAVAMAVPWLFHRSGRDPAFGSGPLGTVIQDLISILVYFLIARIIVG